MSCHQQIRVISKCQCALVVIGIFFIFKSWHLWDLTCSELQCINTVPVVHCVWPAWLAPVPGDPLRASCLVCHVSLHAKMTSLMQHARTAKHVQNMRHESQRNDSPEQKLHTPFGCVALDSVCLSVCL